MLSHGMIVTSGPSICFTPLTVVVRISAGNDGRSAGAAAAGGQIRLIKAHSVRCQPVNIGRAGSCVSVTAIVIPADIISDENDDSWLVSSVDPTCRKQGCENSEGDCATGAHEQYLRVRGRGSKTGPGWICDSPGGYRADQVRHGVEGVADWVRPGCKSNVLLAGSRCILYHIRRSLRGAAVVFSDCGKLCRMRMGVAAGGLSRDE